MFIGGIHSCYELNCSEHSTWREQVLLISATQNHEQSCLGLSFLNSSGSALPEYNTTELALKALDLTLLGQGYKKWLTLRQQSQLRLDISKPEMVEDWDSSALPRSEIGWGLGRVARSTSVPRPPLFRHIVSGNSWRLATWNGKNRG